jgi:hypothetical protein
MYLFNIATLPSCSMVIAVCSVELLIIINRSSNIITLNTLAQLQYRRDRRSLDHILMQYWRICHMFRHEKCRT